ncbi:MAG: hypothetical protein EHM35_18555, partial [Planctomycetaceae bacterium]
MPGDDRLMIYVFGDCELDTSLYTLQRAGQTNRLRPKVFRVCLYLLEHRERVVTREELCAQVWPGQFISQATLEGVIRTVRQVVGDSGQTQSIIQTLHGYGYRFIAHVEERSPKGVGVEAPRPSALLAVPQAPGLDPTDCVVAADEAVQEPEAPSTPVQPVEMGQHPPGKNGHRVDVNT